MDHFSIITSLGRNKHIFKALLSGLSKEEYLWKSQPDKWCMLEIVCHLHDEEREDFRFRTKHILENPELVLPPIDPPAWVHERKYMDQDFEIVVEKFLTERQISLNWLQTLESPKWENVHHHPKLGEMTAKMMLTNWLAHDYLHIRQITKVKFDHLQVQSKESLSYAGVW